jgi:hypothetical protein
MQLELVLMLLCNVFKPSRYISNVPLPTILNHLEATSSYEILKKYFSRQFCRCTKVAVTK